MDISNKFLVAEFEDEEGTVFIEAFPSLWLKNETVFWPESQKLRKKRSIRDFEPDVTNKQWVGCKLRSIKACYDDYPDAAKLANELEIYSDTSDECSNKVILSSHRQIFKQKTKSNANDYNDLIRNAVQTQETDNVLEVTGEKFDVSTIILENQPVNSSTTFLNAMNAPNDTGLMIGMDPGQSNYSAHLQQASLSHTNASNTSGFMNDMQLGQDELSTHFQQTPLSPVVLNVPPLAEVLKYIARNDSNSSCE